MKKNVLKIILDIVMAAILILLYNSHVLGLDFHEIGGLGIFGLFVIHCLLNRSWIARVSTRLFDKSLPARTKLGYMVDLLLAISFTLIIISGISISKVLFPSSGANGAWRTVHEFCSALTIILMGIHIGLHWGFISGMFKKVIKLPPAAAKPIGAVLLSALLLSGAYNIYVSNFKNWLAAPFTTTAGSEGHQRAGGQNSTRSGNPGEMKENIDNTPQSKDGGGQNQESGRGGAAAHGVSITPSNVLGTMARYLSIISVFAFITVLVDRIGRRKKPGRDVAA